MSKSPKKHKRLNKKLVVIIAAVVVAIIGIVVGSVFFFRGFSQQGMIVDTQPADTSSDQAAPVPPADTGFVGQTAAIGQGVTIKVPAGWAASVSKSQSFLGVMFARPNKLDTLVYDPSVTPAIDYDGIPSWGGLTEHFYVRVITASSQTFRPTSHREVTSEPFTFADSTVGEKYLIIKHAEEAAAFGGLKKDNEWQGRVYTYKKGDVSVEAHIALYPSTKVDLELYEDVVRSIELE